MKVENNLTINLEGKDVDLFKAAVRILEKEDSNIIGFQTSTKMSDEERAFIIELDKKVNKA